MKSAHWKKAVSLLVTLGIMAAIFCFSAQPAVVSGAVSDAVADNMRDSGIGFLAPVWFSPNIYANIRKWAHLYIFLLLGASVACTVQYFFPAARCRWKGAGAAVFCVLYAAGDELHQYFVPGRAMLAEDVLLDSAGALLGVLVFFGLLRLWQRRQNHHS